jgi:hypothetical protein
MAVIASGTWPKGHSLGQNSGHCERSEAICLLGARGLFLGAFLSEATLCKPGDCFGKKRLAMTKVLTLNEYKKNSNGKTSVGLNLSVGAIF